MQTTDYKIAYVSRTTYPSPTAHALQTINIAAALARHTQSTFLFVRGLDEPEAHIRQQYLVGESPLELWSLNVKRWPSFLYTNRVVRTIIWNSVVVALLSLNRRWRNAPGSRSVLFVRSGTESLYWGLMRPYLWGLRDWFFVYEIHDVDHLIGGATSGYHTQLRRTSHIIKALTHYDLVLAKTVQLASTLQTFTDGAIKPEVFPNGSGLRRDTPPIVQFKPEQITLGYIGTVDLSHGVDDLLVAMRYLPDKWKLRLVGRVPFDSQSWFNTQVQDSAIAGRVEHCPPTRYSEIAAEIDACDILLAPSDNSMLSKNYRSPLKIFDYMARGKPIVAARVPAHTELLTDGVNAWMFRPANPKDLAERLKALVEQPEYAHRIAKAAWELSEQYTYDARAKHLLNLIDKVWDNKIPSRNSCIPLTSL